MLRQASEQDQTISAGPQISITPKELAAAIVSLQAKREKDSQVLSSKPTLEQTLHDLGIEATPEEVLAEVQTGRAQKTAVKSKHFGRWAVALTVGAGALVTYLAGSLFLSRPTPPQDGRFVMTAPSNIFVEDISAKGAPIHSLSSVPDGHAVRCSLGELGFYSFVQDKNSWMLIKHAGKVYVRGYSIIGQEAAAGQPNLMTIHNDNSWYPHAAALTLPLDQFKRLPGPEYTIGINHDPAGLKDDAVGFTATDVHLDQHAYEKW